MICKYLFRNFNFSIVCFFTGTFQLMHGDEATLSQASLSRIISDVSTQIAHLRPQYIQFPTTPLQIQQTQQRFFDYCQFPGVVGAIDCTHVHIRSPGGDNAQRFLNRKGRFSINVQVRVIGLYSEVWLGVIRGKFICMRNLCFKFWILIFTLFLCYCKQGNVLILCLHANDDVQDTDSNRIFIEIIKVYELKIFTCNHYQNNPCYIVTSSEI